MRKSLWQEELHKVRKEYKGHCTPLNEEKIKEGFENWYAGTKENRKDKSKENRDNHKENAKMISERRQEEKKENGT